jgi:hypothetical protein
MNNDKNKQINYNDDDCDDNKNNYTNNNYYSYINLK